MNRLNQLEKLLNLFFNKKELLQTALTHRSYLNESNQEMISNERLEFLGDAVLEFIVSSYLFLEYPELNEGILTSIRSAAVKTETLAETASKIKLGDYLYLSRGEELGGGRTNVSLLADTFEALIGAIYIDQGIDPTREFLSKNILELIPDIIKNKAYLDYKSQLQIIIQEKQQVTPVYQVVRETGPDHDKVFYVYCLANNLLLGKGKGKSKQQAEQEAAKNALEKLEE